MWNETVKRMLPRLAVKMTTQRRGPVLASPATAAFNRKDESLSLTEVTARLEKALLCVLELLGEKSPLMSK